MEEKRTMNQQIGVKAIIEKDNKILFIKRSNKYTDLEDAWDIPGGRLEFGEEPEDGLRREIKEETGLELDQIKQILDATTVFTNEEKQIVRITYFCTIKETNEDHTISDEHTHAEWVPKEKIKTLEMKDTILKKVIDAYF